MKKSLLSALAFFCLIQIISAQEETTTAVTETKNWEKSASLGLDLSQLLLINPKFGAGENRLGFGGVAGGSANYAQGKWIWENKLGWQFAVQRLGSTENSFTKNVDQLDLLSKGGYALSADKKWYAALEGALRTQITSTFGTNQLKSEGNVFVPATDTTSSSVVTENYDLLSEFFSPAIMTLAPGIDYKPTENLSFLLSPATSRLIYVANDALAALGVHGNEVTKDANGVITDYKNTFYQLGASLAAQYGNKYLNDKLIFNTRAFFFSNYLENPQNIDVEWTNEFAYEILKGLSLGLNIGMYYDHDIDVLVDRNGDGYYDANNASERGKRLQLIEAFNVKYTKNF